MEVKQDLLSRLRLQILDLAMNGPLAVGATYASLTNRVPEFMNVDARTFMYVLSDLEGEGLVDIYSIPAKGETILPTQRGDTLFKKRYEEWLPGVSMEEAAADPIGGMIGITAKGREVWKAWRPDSSHEQE